MRYEIIKSLSFYDIIDKMLLELVRGNSFVYVCGCSIQNVHNDSSTSVQSFTNYCQCRYQVHKKSLFFKC